MRTEEEIKKSLKWLLKAIDDEENQSETMQIKLWTKINFINWIVDDPELFRQWCTEGDE